MYWTHTGYSESAPESEPVTAAEAKSFARIDTDVDDTLVGSLIVAARQVIEAMSGVRMISRTVTMYADHWPQADHQHHRFFRIPVWPIASVDSVKYYDSDNELQTWDSGSYDTDTTSRPGRISLGYGETWPTLRDRLGAVQVAVTAGYSDSSSDVPQALRMAVRAAVADVYEHREQNIETSIHGNPAVRNLLAAYMLPGVA